MDKSKILIAALLLALVLAVSFWYGTFRWTECRTIHTALYCIGEVVR